MISTVRRLSPGAAVPALALVFLALGSWGALLVRAQTSPGGGPASTLPGVDGLERIQVLGPEGPWAESRLVDLSGDGRDELLLIGRDGRIHHHSPSAEGSGFTPEPTGTLEMPSPERTLLCVADILGDGAAQLVALRPEGLFAHGLDGEGRLDPKGRRIARQAKFSIRVGRPSFAKMAQDVNRDGYSDLVIPGPQACELWLNVETERGGEKVRGVRRVASIAVEVERFENQRTEAASFLLSSSFEVPGLRTQDVNGDDRPDLLVVDDTRRGFHLQREDGSFPEEADVRVNLEVFEDTIDQPRSRPGHTLVLSDKAALRTADLDLDGFTDYVVTHRRKIWVFRGSAEGPQFREPSTILKTADDVTSLAVANLDEDGHPDLLVLKIQVPTIATLVRGLLSEWDISVSALAYANNGEGGFAKSPTERGELTLRLPAILRLLKRPDEFLSKLEEAGNREEIGGEGDLDGDGTPDLLLADSERKSLRVWLGQGSGGSEDRPDEFLRHMFFEDSERVWDLDRVFLAMGDLAQQRFARQTGNRDAVLSHPLRDPSTARLLSIQVGRLGPESPEQVVLTYRMLAGAEEGRIRIDVLRLGD